MKSGKAKKTVGQKIRTWLFVCIVFSAAIAPAILTSKYGYGISPILTGSMQPAAQPGDVFVTRLVSASSVKVGDIIAVNSQTTGAYYSHRVVEVRLVNGALRITTKGDANSLIDRDPYMVSRTGTLSVVQMRIPLIGRPMVYMNTVQGRQTAASFLVIANLLALFVFMFRKKIVASLTPERVYKDLYNEERLMNMQYRDLINNLQDSLAIEREIISSRENNGNTPNNQQPEKVGINS